MSVFTPIAKKALNWASPQRFFGEFYLEIGSGFLLDIGDGNKLIIQSDTTRQPTNWTEVTKTR